MKLRETYGNLS